MACYQLPETEMVFSHPSLAEPDGLLAIGGDLSVRRLLLAYSNGVFPWYTEGQPVLWWSPDPRLLLFPEEFKASKSLQRTVRQKKFKVTGDIAFDQVIRHCAETPRKGQKGTWITEEMITAYNNLHKAGYAHSFETWQQGKLVGGLYGVSLGRAFFGESMFHKATDASKVAFYHFVERLRGAGFRFIDAQVYTPHLASLGAREVSREEYLDMLDEAVKTSPPGLEFWKFSG